MRNFKRISISFFGILLCIVVGMWLTYTFLSPESGRDFRLGALISALLIGVFAVTLRAKCEWGLGVFLISLAIVEAVLLLVIMWMSGSFVLNSFNLNWFVGLSLYIALPWVIGMVAGSFISNYFLSSN